MAKAGKFAALATYRQNSDEVEPESPPIAGEAEGSSAEPEAAAGTDAVPTDAPSEGSKPLGVMDTIVVEAYIPPKAKAPAPPPRPRGRPPGKRSDPEWKLFSHFLKRSTQRQATAVLFEADDGRDLSDVLQALLEKWVSAQRAKR